MTEVSNQTSNGFLDDVSTAFSYKWGPKCQALFTVSVVSGLALFIIACLGMSGALPASTVGWCAVGIGGGTFLLRLANGDLKKRKCDVVVDILCTATLVILGSLGSAGVLSAYQLGSGIIGAVIIARTFGVCDFCRVMVPKGGDQKVETETPKNPEPQVDNETLQEATTCANNLGIASDDPRFNSILMAFAEGKKLANSQQEKIIQNNNTSTHTIHD